MTDDETAPRKIISRRKSRPKGPQAQDVSQGNEPERVRSEIDLRDLNVPTPAEEEQHEEPVSETPEPVPEPVPEPAEEMPTQQEFTQHEEPSATAEEFAQPVNPEEYQQHPPEPESLVQPEVPAPPLAEAEPPITSRKNKKSKRGQREEGLPSSVSLSQAEDTAAKKKLSRKERREIKQQAYVPAIPRTERDERKKGFSIFRFSAKKESLVRAKAEIEENQRRLFGSPKRTDAVSIQKMTQPISRRIEFTGTENTAPKVPGYMKVALALFRDYYTLRPTNTKLEEGLRKSKMPYSTVQYESLVLLSTIIAICVGSMVLGALYYLMGELVLLGAPVVVLGSFSMYVIAMNIPGSKINKRRKNIEARLPMALAYIATMASADIPVEHIMYELGKTTEYGEIAKEARAISASSRLFGNDIVTALREEAKYSPSGKLAEFLSGITSTVTSGGSLKDYFTMKAKQFQSELSTLIKQNAESVGVLAESYVTVGVAFPLMFIVILGVLVAMTPNASAIVLLLYLMVLMMIPLITFVFAFIIQSTVKEVPI